MQSIQEVEKMFLHTLTPPLSPVVATAGLTVSTSPLPIISITTTITSTTSPLARELEKKLKKPTLPEDVVGHTSLYFDEEEEKSHDESGVDGVTSKSGMALSSFMLSKSSYL
jgi:hypothetical protein